MTPALPRFVLAVLTICFVALASGCKERNTMPPPLPVEQLPAALEKAFANASADAKEMAGQIAALVRSKDYAKAHPQLQQLGGLPKLSAEQSSVTSRGLLTLNELLQAAQAQGDAQAAQTLQNYRANK